MSYKAVFHAQPGGVPRSTLRKLAESLPMKASRYPLPLLVLCLLPASLWGVFQPALERLDLDQS